MALTNPNAAIAKYILGVLVLVALGLGIYWLGYDHAKQKLTAEHLKQELEIRNELERQRQQAAEKDWKTIVSLRSDLAKAKKQTEKLADELSLYRSRDEVDRLCGPNVGVVRVLNAARRPDLPADPIRIDDQSRAPSGLTQSDLYRDTLRITDLYNELMIRHNALLDRLEGYGGTKPEQ